MAVTYKAQRKHVNGDVHTDLHDLYNRIKELENFVIKVSNSFDKTLAKEAKELCTTNGGWKSSLSAYGG